MPKSSATETAISAHSSGGMPAHRPEAVKVGIDGEWQPKMPMRLVERVRQRRSHAAMSSTEAASRAMPRMPRKFTFLTSSSSWIARTSSADWPT